MFLPDRRIMKKTSSCWKESNISLRERFRASRNDRIRQLGLWTLEERRNRADLLQVFNMYKGLSSANQLNSSISLLSVRQLQHVDTPPRLLNADAIWTLDVFFSPQG